MSTLAHYPCPALLQRIPRGRHAVIEASAGTGKTYTIEHLVVDRLIAGAPLDAILVVTFTDKATGELRMRIRKLVTAVLAQPLNDPPSGPHWRIDPTTRQRLEDALFAFDRAPIYTIHGFCHRVLSDMAFESGQLFDLEIIDGHRAFNRAWREALRTELAREHAGLLRTWLDSFDENALERLLYQARQQRYLDGWVPLDERLPRMLSDLRAAVDVGAYVTDLAGVAIQRKAFDAAEPTLRAVVQILERDATPAEQLDALVRLDLRPLTKPHRTSTRGGKRAFPEGLSPRSQAVLHHLDRLLTARTLAGSLEREVVDRFLPVVERFLEGFKRREGVLDYDDLLDRVWAGLRAQTPASIELQTTLRGRYRCAFIDEFQDTDDRQWDIFRQLFVEGEQGHDLAIIGDPKQAIYGFRGADVHTYLRARAELLERGAVRVSLDVNYRSTGGVVAAVNTILDQGARPPFFDGAITYDAPVSCGRTALRLVDGHDEDQPAIMFWRYTPKPPGPRSRSNLPKYELQQALASQLGDSLDRLLNREEGALFIKDGDAPRQPIRPKDVYVLVRGGYDAVDVADALRVRGIPYAFYKQEGLFQTREARDVREVLAAVLDPHARSARMRALATPFFAIDWAGLRDFADLPGGHPLLERIYGWAQLGVNERFATLFHRLMHHSGLVERALFLDDTERELCNYQHIFEVLLEHVARRKLSLAECIELLDRFIDGTEMPEGGQSNVQRLPNERDAVQIMTIHKSKGLEAPVVCVFGGFGGNYQRPVNVVHDADGTRRVLIGEAARMAHVDRLAREARQEDQRLLYVALTRARLRVYLPLIDSSRAIAGAYSPLKDRLYRLQDNDLPAQTWTSPTGAELPLFDAITVPQDPPKPRQRQVSPKEPLDAWRPPAQLVTPSDDAADYATLHAQSAAMQVTSYTRLKEDGVGAAQVVEEAPVEPDEFKVDAPDEPATEANALPGGRHVGRFLHEVIESLDFGAFERRQPFAAWARDPDVRAVFEICMRRHGVEPQWIDAAQVLIYAALGDAIRLGEIEVDGLARCRHAVEMEFLYPIPETHHPLLSAPPGDDERPWTAERGFIKGFIDYIFEHDGRIYFADWKSDILPDYRRATLEAHVGAHYALQARLYSLGVVRWLQIRTEADYTARFGGLLYLFLRGQGGDGVYFERPSWADIVAWEADLLALSA